MFSYIFRWVSFTMTFHQSCLIFSFLNSVYCNRAFLHLIYMIQQGLLPPFLHKYCILDQEKSLWDPRYSLGAGWGRTRRPCFSPWYRPPCSYSAFYSKRWNSESVLVKSTQNRSFLTIIKTKVFMSFSLQLCLWIPTLDFYKTLHIKGKIPIPMPVIYGF